MIDFKISWYYTDRGEEGRSIIKVNGHKKKVVVVVRVITPRVSYY